MEWQNALTLLQKSHEVLSAENRTLKNELNLLNIKLLMSERKVERLGDLATKYTPREREGFQTRNIQRKLENMQQDINTLENDNNRLYALNTEYIKQCVLLNVQMDRKQVELNQADKQLSDAKVTINDLYTVIAGLQQREFVPQRRGAVRRNSTPILPVRDRRAKCVMSCKFHPNMVTTQRNLSHKHKMIKHDIHNANNAEIDSVENESDDDAKDMDTGTIIITYTDDSDSECDAMNNMKDFEVLFLAKRGYKRGRQRNTTFEGFMYDIESNKTGFKYLLKQMDKCKNGGTYVDTERIVNEKSILEFITKQNAPSFLLKFVDWFESERCYYLITEHGDSNLFDFIVSVHQHIDNGTLAIKEWRKFVKYIFWQMCVSLLWLHNTVNITHLNVAPDNILLQNGRFVDKGNGQLSISTEIGIKFSGFDFAEFHNDDGFMSKTYQNERNIHYKSHQVYSGKGQFDARKADVWSLGVVLFCMAVGKPPYLIPGKQDKCYDIFVKNGQIVQLLYGWKRHHYVTQKMLSLMKSMLAHEEDKRYLMDDVIQHPWLSTYYNKKYEMVKSDILSTVYQGQR